MNMYIIAQIAMGPPLNHFICLWPRPPYKPRPSNKPPTA